MSMLEVIILLGVVGGIGYLIYRDSGGPKGGGTGRTGEGKTATR